MSTFAVLVLVVSAVRIFADQDVKNVTAAGSYGYEQPYSAPNYNGGYNYPPFYNGQYGPYGPYGPYGQFGPNFDVLKNSYVCSTDVAYGVYTSQNSASRGPGPFVLDCSDVYYGGYNPTKMDKGYTSRNCEMCCRKAAHLNGMSENVILGMMLILDKKPKCSCCAPAAAFNRLMAVPVPIPAYQPPPPAQPYQQPPVASYQPPAYPTNNNQPTGY